MSVPRSIDPHVYAVILAGGSGTRFWPMSRHLYPKQLLHLTDHDTLIQQTVRRVLRNVPEERLLISTTHDHIDALRIQLSEWPKAIHDNVLVEPDARNTAPAIALAATALMQKDPEALMLVTPADHVIKGEDRFQDAVTLGVRLAQQGRLVTFGVRPQRPETGYGYIQPDLRTCLAADQRLTAHPVKRFIEKPIITAARRYAQAGRYYWNSGIFVFRAATILEEIARYQPHLSLTIQGIGRSMHAGRLNGDPKVARAYQALKPLSIDYAVMERSRLAAMIPVEFCWSDVGTWSSLHEINHGDTAGNVISGNVIDQGSRNSVLYGDRRLVATIGLSDMIVVDTPDATLVCPKEQAQEVKHLVDELKQRNMREYREHQMMVRPWGTYTVLEEQPGFKVKRLSVNHGSRLSLQMHYHRHEHWVVAAGTARVTRGNEVFEIAIGQTANIPPKTPHRLENPGPEMLHVIETQTGSYLEEDDIIRLQDDYGRVQLAQEPNEPNRLHQRNAPNR